MALADTAQLAVRINLEGNAAAGLSKMQKQVNGLGRSLGKTGKGVGQIASGFARAGLVVGGAAITGITAVAKAAIDFEDAFAGVRKTLNASDKELDAIALQFRKMATEIPVAATELARIGETAGALGIAKKDITSFTKVVAELSETTNLTSDAAAESLGKVGTILGLHGRQFEQFADTLVNLGNQGASTESEIIEVTKRFAAMGKQAGLTSNQILALSSAATSLGAEPEAAGSALSRIFGNMSREIANSTKKGKAFAKVTGKSITTLQHMVDKGQGLPILLDTLKGISKMSRTQAASTLKALGINNVRDVNAILLMSQNLKFVNDQLEIADHSKGALGKEFGKRMATTAAKVKLLENNVKEAAITVGTEFLPAVQRKISEIIDVLKEPGTKNDLKQLGQDIGKAIDNINIQQVITKGKEFVGILRGALDVALKMYDAFNALPGPIKEAAAGFLVINKLSGGLIGTGVANVASGLAETVARAAGSKLPGVGKLFAQPVFVTNWPVGFGAPGIGGAGGAKGIGSTIGGVIKGALAITVAAAIVESAVPIGKAFASALPPALKGPGGSGMSEAQRRITEARGQMAVGQHGGLSPDARDEQKKLAEIGLAVQRKGEQTVSSVTSARDTISSDLGATKTAIGTSGRAIQNTTRTSTLVGAQIGASATFAASGAIIAAIWAARPVVNVTNVTKTYNNTVRYGATAGSQGSNNGWSGGPGASGPLP